VNNAGIQKVTPSHEIEMADFDRVMNVNLRGAYLCAREALRHFVERGTKGVILNNSSVHEIIPKPKYLP
ncbi:MAG TPA: sugar dehydrogenase, partial [Solibacterales bacterium]|nr:sugar dehydrogenase [Bryobacterales bacterium]